MSSNDDFQELMAGLDMEYWLDREGIQYRVTHGSSGTQLNIKECPCCGGTNYKVFLNADTGLGNCFSGSCGEKFNRWKFIAACLNVSNREVAEHIRHVGAEIGWQPAKKAVKQVSLATNELNMPQSYALPINERNLRYLEKRNISKEIAAYFHLRFCQKGQFDYVGRGGSKMAQNYDGRIIIPIFDLEGELVSFQGRDITGEADKKYLFPPGFASTGQHLYNAQNAVGAARIVIGEGVFDVAATKIALDGEAALRDVVPVGSFGKSLTAGSEQSQLAKVLQLKAKGLRQATFMWDAEASAIKAAISAGLVLHKCGIQSRLAVLPPGCDPNEVAPEVVRAAFWGAEVITPVSATRLLLKHRAR